MQRVACRKENQQVRDLGLFIGLEEHILIVMVGFERREI